MNEDEGIRVAKDFFKKSCVL